MNAEAEENISGNKPWHLWPTAIIAFLWYLSGTITIVLAQLGKLGNIDQAEAAYYAAQPMWFMLLTDVSLFSALAGSIFLMLRNKMAVNLFGISLTTIIITNLYDFAKGTSRALDNTGALVVTLIVIVIAVLLLLYTRALEKKNILQ